MPAAATQEIRTDFVNIWQAACGSLKFVGHWGHLNDGFAR
jgi:hypothetical protein